MKLETSAELLARLRARHSSSWYGMGRLLGASKNTLANWRAGRTIVDRKFAPRLAELVELPPEYVLACLEAERESDDQVRELYQSIGAKFRAHAASILLFACLIAAAGRPALSNTSTPASANAQPDLYIM